MAVLRIKSLNYDALVEVPRDRARWNPCLYCWEPMQHPTWDHVIPTSKGGPNVRGNLVVVCKYCNADKGDLALWEYEGIMFAFNPALAKRVNLFRRWVTHGWLYEELAEIDRLVAASWAETRRERLQPRHDDRSPRSDAIRAALSRFLRTSMQRGGDQGVRKRDA